MKVMLQFCVGTRPELKSQYVCIINSAVSSKRQSYMETLICNKY
jgi:hypothetical protein